jgi:hypothetical protein
MSTLTAILVTLLGMAVIAIIGIAVAMFFAPLVQDAIHVNEYLDGDLE